MGSGQKVYMPVVIGDWLKGTRGMRADVRGVYMGLLLHQWEKGFIPSDMSDLEEIEREVGKVWDKLKDKFIEIAPGKLQNEKLEEVREFWQKQKKNGKKGGRPKDKIPKVNPNNNPEANPKHNHHNDIDHDSDIELKNKKENEKTFDEQVAGLDESLAEVEMWTNQVIAENDAIFLSMSRDTNVNGDLERLARDHLKLCARYRWHEKMESQHAFRLSLLGHIADELKKLKPDKGQKTVKKFTLDELNER